MPTTTLPSTAPEPDASLIALGWRWSSAVAKVKRLARAEQPQDAAIADVMDVANMIASTPARTVRGALVKLRVAVHESVVAAGEAGRDASWWLVDDALAALSRAPVMEGV